MMKSQMAHFAVVDVLDCLNRYPRFLVLVVVRGSLASILMRCFVYRPAAAPTRPFEQTHGSTKPSRKETAKLENRRRCGVGRVDSPRIMAR